MPSLWAVVRGCEVLGWDLNFGQLPPSPFYHMCTQKKNNLLPPKYAIFLVFLE